MTKRSDDAARCDHCTLKVPRRQVLRVGAAGAVTVALGSVFPGCKDQEAAAQLLTTQRASVGRLSELKLNEPLLISYPAENAEFSEALLVKLGVPAGGGVGPSRDVVAFSAYCTHMGGSLADGYLAEHKIVGCSEHLTTFDLTRHGMIVAGHASQSLPQLVLEVEGDAIFATGFVGLLYGHDRNPVS